MYVRYIRYTMSSGRIPSGFWYAITRGRVRNTSGQARMLNKSNSLRMEFSQWKMNNPIHYATLLGADLICTFPWLLSSIGRSLVEAQQRLKSIVP